MWYIKQIEYDSIFVVTPVANSSNDLEGNCIVIVSSINFLGNPAVCTISTDDQVHLQFLWLSDLCAAILVVIIVKGVCPLMTILTQS